MGNKRSAAKHGLEQRVEKGWPVKKYLCTGIILSFGLMYLSGFGLNQTTRTREAEAEWER